MWIPNGTEMSKEFYGEKYIFPTLNQDFLRNDFTETKVVMNMLP